jgi:Protein of unknown function (DUF3833)
MSAQRTIESERLVTDAHANSNQTPLTVTRQFDLPTFFAGSTKAWGIFEDRFGRMRRRFDVELYGSWQGDVFKLDEHFVYDDGRTEQRIWLIRQLSAGHFEATCDDCIGSAAGSYSASMVQMSYAFRLRLPSRTITVDIDDRFHRVNANTAINRATVRKWGIKVGEISLFFMRQEPADSPEQPDQSARIAAQ